MPSPRAIPWGRVLAIAQVVLARVGEDISDKDRKKLASLVRKSKGNPRNLSPAERGYLTETLGAVLGLESRAEMRVPSTTSTVEALLRDADSAVAATLAGWKERYGLD